MMVPVALASTSTALKGEDRLTVNVSLPSLRVSPTTGTASVLVNGSPGFQVSDVDTVVKSLPAVAVPLAVAAFTPTVTPLGTGAEMVTAKLAVLVPELPSTA